MIAPRALALRGHHPVAALAFPRGDEARLIAAWSRGAKAWDLGDRWLLVWTSPQVLDAAAVPGQPFVRDRGLRAFPVTEAERRALAATDGEVIDVHHGAIRRLRATVEAPVADWFDLDDLVRLDALPLGDPPAPPVLALIPASTALAARGFARRDDVQAALAALRGGRSWLSAPLGWAARAFLAAQQALPQPSGPGLLQRFDALLGRLSLAAGLGAVMGARWSRFLEQMVARFDTDVLEALKYAIPLGGAGIGFLGDSLGWMLPGARGGLGFSGGGVGRSLSFDADLYQQLKRIYRRAFEKLDQMSRIDEAAWVLAELLGEVGEAVLYLEKHQKYGMAADIAEAKGQPIDLVIRLRWRAGDAERAVATAILHRAFAAAIAGCGDDADLARELRRAWGQHRVALGDWVGAVDIFAEDPALRDEAATALEAGLSVGGDLEARLLPRRFDLHPDGADTFARARGILDGVGPDADGRRVALVAEVASRPRAGGWHDVLTRRIARAGFAHPALTDVATVADQALGADLARVKRPSPTGDPPGVTGFDPKVGGGTIEDLAAVGRGRLLIARGELGAALLDADGRVRFRWDAPAHAIVLGDRQALLLAFRKDWVAVTQVNLDNGAAAPWGELVIGAWADRCDELWFVATKDAVMALDTRSGKALWRVEAGAPRNVAAGPAWLSFQSVERGVPTVFRYERPSLTLRQREVTDDDALGGPALGWRLGPRALQLVRQGEPASVDNEAVDHDLRLVAVADDGGACVVVDAGAVHVAQTGEEIRVTAWATPARRVAWLTPPTTALRAHLHHGTWTLTCQGEGLVIDLATGRLLRRLRDV